MRAYKPNDGSVLAAVEDQIQTAFHEGFAAAPDAANPYLWSSSCWVAFIAGRLHRGAGGGLPMACRTTRGCAVKLADGAVYRLVGGTIIQTERGK
jgi:hypothetical protein